MSSVPPVDSGNQTELALSLLNRLRNAYNKSELPDQWKRWVFDSFVNGVNAKPLIPKETETVDKK